MDVIRGQFRFWEVVQKVLSRPKVSLMSVWEVWRLTVVAQ